MTTTTNLEWGPPPEKHRTEPTDWNAIAAELKANPGEWALVARNQWAAAAVRINDGLYAAFRPAGSFEATARRDDDLEKPKVNIWARYLGEPEGDSQ